MKDKIINTIVEKITSEVNISLNSVTDNHNKKFDLVIEHLEKLRLEVSTLDKKLNQKEMRDKMDYGQTQYKISSLQNELKDTRPKKKKNLDQSH
jgi:hypothetical protein